MINNSYYSQEVHGPYELHDIGNLELEEGGTIRGCQLAYATFGALNAARDNAILIPTWYSGTNKIMEQVYIGTGRALDPDRYFIIIVNQIGSGLSTSPHNTPPPAGMGNFPHVRIGDDVRAQHKLVTEKFGLKRFALVVGGSMGAQQTYEWAVRYPDMVKRAAPIAGTARNTIHDFLFTETLVDAITSDSGFNKGFYTSSADVREGLLRHAKMWAVMGWSTEFFQENRHKSLGFSSLDDFIINFMYGYFSVMDPTIYCAWHGSGSAATSAAIPAATCGPRWVESKPRPLSCRCLRFSRRLIARPNGGSYPMRSSGRSKPSMDISRYSAPIPRRSLSSTSTWASCLRQRFNGPYFPNDRFSDNPARSRDARHLDRARLWRRELAARRRPAPLEQADAVARHHAGVGAGAVGDADAAGAALSPGYRRWFG